MDQQHQEMRRRLDDFAETGGIGRIPDDEIQDVIGQAKKTIYRAIAGQRNSRCVIPKSISRSGKIQYCGSSATQACHSGQKGLFEALSEPATQAPKQTCNGNHSNWRVLDVFSKDPKHWQNEILKAKLPWDLERVPLQSVRPPSASTRPFACNSDDNNTFAIFERWGLMLPQQRNLVSFKGSDPGMALLDDQLWRISLRNLLFHHNLVGSLRDALSLPIAGSKSMRNATRKAMHRNQLRTVSPAHQVLTEHKWQYDHRLLGVREFELVHHLIPMVTAAAATLADYYVEDGRENPFDHMALTLWPTNAVQRDHWLIISHPESIGYITKAAGRSNHYQSR